MQEDIGRLSIFIILRDKKREHIIDPFKGITCHSQGIEPGWGG